MTYRGQLFGKLAGKYVSLDMQSSDVDAKDARIAELEAHQECQMREEGALRDTIDGLKEELAAEEAARKEWERIAKLVDDDLFDIEQHVENGHPLPPKDDPYWPASKAIEHIRALLTPEGASEQED